MTTGREIVGASLWSVLGEAISSVAAFLGFLAYAVLLSPSDFGIVAFCLSWTSLFQTLIENCLKFALVRSRNIDGPILNAAFRGNVAFSLLGFSAMFLLAPSAAALLHDDHVRQVLPAMGLQLFFVGLSATHVAIAQRGFEFRKLFAMRLLSTGAALIAGISLAAAGFGYWSLVAANLVGGVTQVVCSWWLVRWRPGRCFSGPAARELYRFAAWTAVDLTVTWGVMWSGALILGYYRGEHELGLYRVSEQAALAVVGTLLSPLNPVFYSAFARAAQDRTETLRLFDQFTRVSGILASSLAAALILASGALEQFIGNKWRGVGDLVVLSALTLGVSELVLPHAPFLRAQGHPRAVAAMRVVLLAAQMPIYLLIAPQGVRSFLGGRVCLEIGMFFLTYAIVYYVARVPVAKLMRRQVILVAATAASAIGASLFGRIVSLNSALGLVSALCIFGILFAGALAALESQSFRAALMIVRQALRRQ